MSGAADKGSGSQQGVTGNVTTVVKPSFMWHCVEVWWQLEEEHMHIKIRRNTCPTK